ncbi:MAG: TolC family protein [Candidatus Omnitrophica bacterium]|nr:TolC family protein [Candidatus Omnitrophota bacterium]
MRYQKAFISTLVFLALMAGGAPLWAQTPKEAYLTFKDALKRISESSRAVKISRKGTEINHEDVNRARSALLPQVTADAGRQHFVYQPSAVFGAQKVFTSQKDFNFAEIRAYQTLYDFGLNSSNLKAAHELETSAHNDAERASNQSTLEFIALYFDLLESDKLIVVAKEELTSLASHLKDISVLFREGVVTKNEFLTVRVKFGQAREKVLALKNLRKVQVTKLCSLLSLDDGLILSVEDPAVAPADTLKVEDAVFAALMRRPELKGLDSAIGASRFREEANRSSNYPALFTNGGYNYAQNRYQGRNDNWDVELGVKFNVFNGGLTRAEVVKEKKHGEALAEQKKKLEEDIRVEVERAYWELKNSKEKVRVATTSVAQARENLRVNRVQYREGASSSTQVLDAIALVTGAETDLWRGTYETKRAWARLLYSMGKDLDTSFLETPDRREL